MKEIDPRDPTLIEYKEKECPVCGTPITEDKDFCSKRCCENW